MRKGNQTKVKGTKEQFKPAQSDVGSINIRPIKCLNERQEQLKNSINHMEITLTSGLAGSGKTFLALHTALGLLGKKYKKILLVKSVTTVPDEELGYLKGGLEEKMEPFMMSYMGNLRKLVGDRQTEELFKAKLIEVLPLAYVRGLSIDNSIVIIDEAQNLSKDTFKTIITRIGENSKYIFMGDLDQIDRKDKSTSCLQLMMRIFNETEMISTVEFTEDDCVRNPLIPKVLERLKEFNI